MQYNDFISRHNGPRIDEHKEMLKVIGADSVDSVIEQTIPGSIRLKQNMDIPDGISEYEYFGLIKSIASKNKIFRSFIGCGYYETISPAVIIRNILENPSWYTSYTPYQAEISQGRLEALLNFQTMVMELTGMEIANASLLDEATAAAEAMIMLFNSRSRDAVKSGANVFFADENIFPQTLAVINVRAEALGIEVKTMSHKDFQFNEKSFGGIVQYPDKTGNISDFRAITEKAHAAGNNIAVAADIMSLILLTPPAEWGADVVVGSTQRFGIPMGYGGPHAAFFATSDKFKRSMPGRIIGVSKDAKGKNALRMALQTREQHIKRERATSNICTAQALLANMAGMYAVYHGPQGLKKIASDIHLKTTALKKFLERNGYKVLNQIWFDTLTISLADGVQMSTIKSAALKKEINLNYIGQEELSISLNETTSAKDLNDLADIFKSGSSISADDYKANESSTILPESFRRKSDFLTQKVFNEYHSETEMMRYIKKLERKDFSLTHSMISLGSCTMKLNAAMEMLPVSWPEFGNIHPFAPKEQAEGYQQIFNDLKEDLCKITGFYDISFQPNSGAAGEYAGLLVIREFHRKNNQQHRNIVLIPSSAHGTNPASAVMAGFEVVVVKCDDKGNIDVDDLKVKANENGDNLAAFMITYPSTHGVFEESVLEIINIIHEYGGQVYMDGANMNAQVGLTNPATLGADVCHLNLHKTFAIPHGGGGPGVGPIAVAQHLAEFLPNHPVIETGGKNGKTVAAAPFGSAGVLCISHAYIKMMGGKGLTEATKIAILNANYLAASLKKHYQILYTGKNGRVAHEMILECKPFKTLAGISEADIAKRLMDYGFHAPTLSFPVHGTLMIEPTESESKRELDRFVESMIEIHNEIMEVKEGIQDKENNTLKNAPHTADTLISDNWDRPYSREKAGYPLTWIRENKFFPGSERVDDAFGDRNLFCNCAALEE